MAVVVVALYVALLTIQPQGEGWGYGWNLIGFLLYAVPAVLVAGAVTAWRSKKLEMRGEVIARVAIFGSAAFPLVCALVVMTKL